MISTAADAALKLLRIFTFLNKKHLKNVEPIRHCEPPHAHSPGVDSRTPAIAIAQAACDVHDNNNNNNDNDNA